MIQHGDDLASAQDKWVEDRMADEGEDEGEDEDDADFNAEDEGGEDVSGQAARGSLALCSTTGPLQSNSATWRGSSAF